MLVWANISWIRFGYILICNPFTTTYYVAAYKTIHMYYLKKSHDSLNKLCDFVHISLSWITYYFLGQWELIVADDQKVPLTSKINLQWPYM